MQIIKLQVENIKRLKAVTIKPSGAVVQITGRNGAGKSSVLDAIAYGLGGKGAIPDKPIRKGAAGAKIVIDLGDIVVTRRWSVSGNTTLLVESKDGAALSSPQAVLDRLTGRLTFDPLLFLRMAPHDQVETLKRIAGIDFSGLDKQRADLYEQRTQANRDASSASARIKSLPDAEPPAGWVDGAVERDLSELLDAQSKALEQQRDNQALRDLLERHNGQVHEMRLRFDELTRQVKLISEERRVLEIKLADCEGKVSSIVDPDIEAINTRIAQSDSINRHVRDANMRAELAESHKSLVAQSDSLTTRIQQIDQDKSSAIEDASLPVDNIGFDDNGVTLNGLPLDQASSSEQLRASASMAIALNPELRIMLIREGSLLDEEGLAMLAEIAERNDTQIWVERVTNGEHVGVVIEDGCVAE